MYLDEVTKARVAMALDCEGWITIQKCKGSRGIALALVIGLGNTSAILPEWLKSLFGGSIYYTKRHSPAHKDYHTWRIHSKVALELLKACLPYMLIKRAQAELAIEFQETMHGRNTQNEPCTPEYVAKMKAIKYQMGILNRKGKTPPAETDRENTYPVLATGSEVTVRTSLKEEELGRNAQAYAASA